MKKISKIYNVQPSGNRQGTFLVGYIKTSYQDLVKVFGEPERFSDDKIHVEWVFNVDGCVFTIYDYKQYTTPPELVTDWHVGGKGHLAMHLVTQILTERKVKFTSELSKV